jgi:HlyD family secretion protein
MDKALTHKPLLSKKHRGLVVILLTLVLFATLALVRGSNTAFKVEREALTIKEVKAAPFENYISVRAVVEPAHMAYLDAVEGGIVEQITAEEGALLEQGDTLLVLSNLNLSLNILNSEAQLAEKANFLRETQLNMEQQKLAVERELIKLHYDLLQLKRKYGQCKGFYDEGLISKNEFLEAEEAYQMAEKLYKLNLQQQEQDAVFRKVQINKIKQNLDNMERNLALIYKRQEQLIIRAPMNGQLTSLNAIPGEAIAPGHRLGQINDLRAYKLQATVDEHYIDRIHIGLKAQLKKQNELYTATITKVYPEVNKGQFLVDLTFDNVQPENLRSGQTYSLHLQLGDAEEAYLLERGVFFQSTGGHWVYRLSKDGKTAVKQAIRIGRQNPRFYEVLEGLEPGDKVITSSYTLFEENEKLIIH